MKKSVLLFLSSALLSLGACSDDDGVGTSNSVAFATSSVNLATPETQVQILFENPTPSSGVVTLPIRRPMFLTAQILPQLLRQQMVLLKFLLAPTFPQLRFSLTNLPMRWKDK